MQALWIRIQFHPELLANLDPRFISKDQDLIPDTILMTKQQKLLLKPSKSLIAQNFLVAYEMSLVAQQPVRIQKIYNIRIRYIYRVWKSRDWKSAPFLSRFLISFQRKSHKTLEIQIFLLFLLDDRRILIQIRISDKRIRIREAQKRMDPDPEHCQ